MLHGKIELNGVPVGQWEAVRKEKIFTNTYRYDCWVHYRNQEGYPFRANFKVAHYTKAGAMALAGLVISTGLRVATGIDVSKGEPTDFPV